MKKYIVRGGNKLSGQVSVTGAKNVVLKAIVAACLTEDLVEIKNVPLISDFFIMLGLIKEIGGTVYLSGHTVKIKVPEITNVKIPLDAGAKIRTSSMLAAPLLVRRKEAMIPNPGGCRIGTRPIDRHIDALSSMGVKSRYSSRDGYFHLKTDGLSGSTYRFDKNSHTGTETLIMAAVLAKGKTIIENAAEEPEVDDLILLLHSMGAKITRLRGRKIIIKGVSKLHGTTFTIMPDRNEVITFAILSALSGGGILIRNIVPSSISTFLKMFKRAGGNFETTLRGTRFFVGNKIKPTNIVTGPHPSFMTDWQGPWAIFMTQAQGTSTIHETVYENRFGYVDELIKMGADLTLFTPSVRNPNNVYNFNHKGAEEFAQGLNIKGKTVLHNAVLNVSDLRAGASIVIASLIADGTSIIYGAEILERGYETFDKRLKRIGANIEMVEEEEQP